MSASVAVAEGVEDGERTHFTPFLYVLAEESIASTTPRSLSPASSRKGARDDTRDLF